DPLTTYNSWIKSFCLLYEFFDKIYTGDFSNSTNITNCFFRKPCCDFSAKFAARFYQLCFKTPHPTIKRCKQPNRTTTNNGYIVHVLPSLIYLVHFILLICYHNDSTSTK